jgi:glycosyltransferase involved in cell wall biosynthesis
VIIPNGIALPRFVGKSSAVPAHDHPLAIFVARLEPQKDHPTLLRAIARVPDLRLQLVGDGSLRSDLESLASSTGVRDRVEFLGWRDDVSELLRQADFFVHSTHSDGFGIAVVEAMAAGLPVIASAVPGLSWVVGDAGILCKPGDEVELAAQMSRLATDPKLRQELSEKGKTRARQFDIEQAADAHVRLYESLMESGG